MKRPPLALVASLLALGACTPGPRGDARRETPEPPAAATRHFELRYLARLPAAVLAGAEVLDLWLPSPSSDEDQDVRTVAITGVEDYGLSRDPEYGNRIIHVRLERPAGALEVQVVYDVLRRERLRPSLRGAGVQPLSAAERERFAADLAADSRVPVSGAVVEAALREAGLQEDGNLLNAARAAYDHVTRSMRYSREGTGWGTGSTEWALSAGYGNCTDFHALFMSLGRARGIPTRFAIGFPLPPGRGAGELDGYHCWALFYIPGTGWLGVDTSEAWKHPELREYYFGSLTEDRVSFSRGRDIVLDPPQRGAPLNYFIYPYAEVDGVPVEVERECSYRDL